MRTRLLPSVKAPTFTLLFCLLPHRPIALKRTVMLTITTTYTPATDLGYLLHKSPTRLHTFPLSFGQAHVFYPEATTERCSMTLLLDIDPISLVRRRTGAESEGGQLDHYVNDR